MAPRIAIRLYLGNNPPAIKLENRWNLSVPADQFPDLSAAQAAVIEAIPGVNGTVHGSEASGCYVFSIPTSITDPEAVEYALRIADIRARVRDPLHVDLGVAQVDDEAARGEAAHVPAGGGAE